MKDEAAPARFSPGWEQIAPLLDELVARLSREDREAVLLRFYQRKTMADVGKGLHVSEDAAKKRVARAVERLRGLFARKGVSLPAAALGSELLARTTEAASPALVQTIAALATTAPVGGVAASAAGFMIAKGALTAMVMTKVTTAALLALVILVPVGVAWALAASKGETAKEEIPPGAQNVGQVVPQAQPVFTLLKAVKEGDQQQLKTVFSERMQKTFDEEGWEKVLKSYQEAFNKEFGEYKPEDFAFEYAGGEGEGRVLIVHRGKKLPGLQVIKVEPGWKVDER